MFRISKTPPEENNTIFHCIVKASTGGTRAFSIIKRSDEMWDVYNTHNTAFDIRVNPYAPDSWVARHVAGNEEDLTYAPGVHESRVYLIPC